MMLNQEDIARAAHEVNRAYCEAIGDNSQINWDDAPEWQKASAISGVIAHLERDLTPRESHELRCAHKLADGWAWGIEKNEAIKKHPCLIPYDSLPLNQRVKDHLFGAVVQSLKHLTL